MDRSSGSADRTPDAAWQQLVEIGEAERHFNGIESTYRGLASTWVLASFGGMGFAVSAAALPVSRGLVIFAIAAAGSLGVQLLWIVDLLAYHHLLAAYYLEGLRIESRYAALPQVRWNMWRQGIVEGRVKLFYAGCALVLIPFGLTAVLVSDTAPAGKGTAIGCVAILVACVWLLWRRSYNGWLYAAVKRIEQA